MPVLVPTEKLAYLRDTLVPALNAHVQAVKEAGTDVGSNPSDLLSIVEACIEHFGVENSPEFQPRLFNASETNLPTILYWRLATNRESLETVTLADLLFPIGPGYTKDLTEGMFAYTLDGSFIQLKDDEWFIPLPIYNDVIRTPADLAKLLEVPPQTTLERDLLLTGYIYHVTSQKNLEAIKPGYYRNGVVEFRGEWGWINTEGKPVGIPSPGLQLYKEDVVVVDDRTVEIPLGSFMVSTNEDGVKTLHCTGVDLVLNELKEADVVRGRTYRRYNNPDEYVYASFDEELRVRRQFLEHDLIVFKSERECLTAFKHGLIDAIRITEQGTKYSGERFHDLFGFRAWYREQLTLEQNRTENN